MCGSEGHDSRVRCLSARKIGENIIKWFWTTTPLSSPGAGRLTGSPPASMQECSSLHLSSFDRCGKKCKARRKNHQNKSIVSDINQAVDHCECHASLWMLTVRCVTEYLQARTHSIGLNGARLFDGPCANPDFVGGSALFNDLV